MLSATSDMLRLISAHPGDLTTVLHGILAKAAELCGGEAGSITLNEGGSIRLVASHGPAMAPYVGTTVPAEAEDQGLFSGAFHTDDFAAIARGHPYFEQMATVARVRSYAFVLLTHEGAGVGALHMYRHEVRPFTEDELTALATFGEQASLAVANARLFKDLGESLARQRAMTDVLDAVSTARTDLQPVFDALVRHASRLCPGSEAGVVVCEGDDLVTMSFSGDPTLRGAARVLLPKGESSIGGDCVLRREIIHLRDLDATPDLYPSSPARMIGVRSVLSIPMIRNDQAIGAVGFYRQAAGGYTDAEMALLQTFVNQAATAVENARLLREIEQRNGDLAAALALQTAMAEVLRLIS